MFQLEKDLFVKDNFQGYPPKPSQADLEFTKNNSELVELDQLPGRIALEGALPYPPGVFIVAPGEKWRKLNIDYFKVLLALADKFPGFEPEIQGVYQENGQVLAEVLKA